ncbi:actin-like protein Arp1 [Schizosaccharomyces cryophilus OY26]|uniref:Centractin n=1 Tax=Schizosaccharomyces cryophilus (strain OY26 / ATCC MYA-4695 / CBS 11777 / NBRC 106824 / NRRL Y48691) TaxID=653667 RepID=S9W4R8_SCHCR|nr:actin-like protein Arp1 [Schizosaccharomyces cryophilus OY26]EPY53519.1 actin-like protein Arp1 [Schizosaccharomyces cryophilus OY26]
MPSHLQQDTYIGSKAQELRGLLKLEYPVQRGLVKNWHDMEKIWSYVYSNELQTLPEDHPVLLAEPPLNNAKNKERMAETFFETFNVPALSFSLQPVLALYATARTTGLVVEVGEGLTHTVPIFDGFVLSSAQRDDYGGKDITEYLQLQLRQLGYRFVTSAETEIVREIKEACCYVSPNFQTEEKTHSSFNTKLQQFTLPDGQVLKLGSECFRAPELLFRPELIGYENGGIHHQIVQAVMRSDLDLRKDLLSNIVLSGGSTLLKGFGDRLLKELQGSGDVRNCVKMYTPQERRYAAWTGASILASLSTFSNILITSENYKSDPYCIFK